MLDYFLAVGGVVAGEVWEGWGDCAGGYGCVGGSGAGVGYFDVWG